MPDSPIVIREATTRDLEALYRCEQGIIAAERPFDATLKPGLIHYYHIDRMIGVPHVYFLVAAAPDGAVVGCGFARIEAAKSYLDHEQRAYLGLMYVEPAYRGQGINGRIVAELQGWCRVQGVRELRLDVYDANAAAIRAYEKAGFAKHMVEMRRRLEE